MAAVNVTIIGQLTMADGSSQSVTLVGAASLTGLGVGGGPIIPPDQPPAGGGGKPTFPIALPPGSWPPGGLPPLAPGGYPPSAEHPIVIPKPPDIPPDPGTPPDGSGMVKPPPPEGGWGYHPDYGWGYFPGPGEAQPKPA